MKASNLSDAQTAFILKQGDDGVPVVEICRKTGISQATCFNWCKKYSGLLPDEVLGPRLPGSLAVFEIPSEQCYCLCQRARSDAESTFNDACFSTDVAKEKQPSPGSTPAI
jgi:hypothetical protein